MKLEKRKAQVNLKNENENLLEHQFKNEFIKFFHQSCWLKFF